MANEDIKIVVICGSTRPKRKSIHVANIIVQQLEDRGVETRLVDFSLLPLPFVIDESGTFKGQYPDANVQAWSGIAQAADGFIIVSPEYNHGYPGVLKNALDWLYDEFDKKPVGIVGVSSGLVGGARMIEQLRTIAGNFGMYDIKETVMVRNSHQTFDESGKLLDDKWLKQVPKFLDSLLWTTKALKKPEH